MLRRIAAYSVFALLLVACGTSNRANKGVYQDRIEVSELGQTAEVVSAYDIIRRYKLNWLRKRGRSSIQNPSSIKVYLDNDGSAIGGIKALERIDGQDVSTIEYYNPRKAQLRFGSGHTSGAIFVHTRTGEMGK